jgi:mono/diheme cytochrome c family protein
MKRSSLFLLAANLCISVLVVGLNGSMAGSSEIDLTKWTPPDISAVGDDPFGTLVKYGHALFTDISQTCAGCHGTDGFGQHAQTGAGYQFPPLWGPDSYNNGAGMSRLLTAAAYAMHNMPIGTAFNAPALTDEQAYDVAAYIISQKRPEKANLEKDFPIRLQKPIDTPYGPYVDGFSLEQHKYGPFGPIRAKVDELAAESRTANAGEPDNGSGASEPAK